MQMQDMQVEQLTSKYLHFQNKNNNWIQKNGTLGKAFSGYQEYANMDKQQDDANDDIISNEVYNSQPQFHSARPPPSRENQQQSQNLLKYK